MKRCTIGRCKRRHYAKGRCHTHYIRQRQHSPNADTDIPMSLRERLALSLHSLAERSRLERRPRSLCSRGR